MNELNMNEINAISFSDYEYDEYDDYNKIIYIPQYKLYAYYDIDKFVVYQIENEFDQNEHFYVKTHMIPLSFAENLKYIYDMENEIKIISKNNKYYLDNI